MSESGLGSDGWPSADTVIAGRDREIESLRSRLALLEGDYQRIIREVLSCDPLPASSRPDDQLEPPWEVIARLRSRLAAEVESHDKTREIQTAAQVRVLMLTERLAAAEGKRTPLLWEREYIERLLHKLDDGAESLDDRDCAYAATLIREAIDAFLKDNAT